MTMFDTTIQMPGGAWQYCPVHWEPLPEAYAYSSGEAHVYLAVMDEHQHLFSARSDLQRGNKDNTFPAEGMSSLGRQRCLALAMRHFLFSLILGMPADTLHFDRNGAGKPHIQLPDGSTPFHFNQSHVDKYVLLVVSDAPCGIDMEILRDPRRYSNVLRHGFPPDWSARLMNLTGAPERQQRLFTEYWTALESLYKKEGSPSLRSFLRARMPQGGMAESRVPREEFWGCHFNVDGKHVACITLSRAAQALRWFKIRVPAFPVQ